MNPFVVKKPVVTEKTMELANNSNVYTFVVSREVNKNQIKHAVEQLYNVEVEQVNTVMSQPKKRRTGKKRLAAMTTKEKKALVKIKKGQTIEIFDISEATEK